MMNIIIIILAVCLVLVVVALLIFAYNQMLLLNEVNKRLLLMTESAVDMQTNSINELKEKISMLEYETKTKYLEEQGLESDELIPENFNPHEELDNI